MVCISPSSRPWERPVRSERVNMTTVGVTSGVFSIGAALPLSDRFRLSVGGGHPEDSVALQTQWARTCRNSLHTFKCTNQVLPPVTLNHALQRSCSTDTRTVQRMDLCRLSSTPIQPWHQLTEPLWLFSGPKPPCDDIMHREGAPPPATFSVRHRHQSSACWETAQVPKHLESYSCY